MEWSERRRILYALGFAGLIILLAAYPTYLLLNNPPTCFDQKQNGTETGVDCGGGCALSCSSEIKAPRVVWAKVFSLGGNYYDLGAYVENQNAKAGVKNARYTFRVYDAAGSILSEKSNSTEIAPGLGFVLFEPNVMMTGIPDRVEVTFVPDDLTRWLKSSTAPSILSTKNQQLKNTDTKPRFDAVLVNTDPVNSVTNLTLSAVIYDALRHPIAVSKTYVDSISASGEQGIFFTWPNKFTKNPRGGMCTTPVDTMLVFDRSGSMDVGHKNPPEPLTTAKNAALAYLDTAKSSDKVGLVSFADTASSPIDHELSLDHGAASSTLSALAISKNGLQNTNLGDALKAAFEELQSARHASPAKKVIVVLTDGDANRPLDPVKQSNGAYAKEYAAGFAAEAQKSGVQVYAIGLGTSVNEAFLRDRIAGDPARYFSAPTAESLQTIYKTISETVCPPENFITEIIVTPRAIFAE